MTRLKADSPSKIPTALSAHKKSQFTWVKSQGSKTSQTKPEIHQLSSSSVSASTASPVAATPTQTSSKKLHAAAKSADLPQKLLSPKVHPKVPGKTAKEALEGKKLTTSSVSSKRTKVSGGASTSHGSRYRWKAAATTFAAAASGSTSRPSRKSSVYQWTAQKDKKDSASPASRVQHSTSTPLSGSAFKLRSRTKIIRRSGSSPTTEKSPSVGGVMVRSRYSLCRRTPISAKSPIGVRQGHSRVLVSSDRRKLRRLSPSSSITAPWSAKT
ncbi:zinc finger CCCH domain-containing protein 3, partial [Clarias magur]